MEPKNVEHIEKFEEYSKATATLNVDNLIINNFSEVVDLYEAYANKIHELYPDANADMIEAIIQHKIDADFTSMQYDVWVALNERLVNGDIPYWAECRPWECESCGQQKCEHRMREEKDY
jgi:hypothetical protein